VDIKIDKVYFETLLILNDSILSYEKRTELLLEIFKNNPVIQRLFATFLIQFNKEFFFENTRFKITSEDLTEEENQEHDLQ
jgi:hypothetical protein